MATRTSPIPLTVFLSKDRIKGSLAVVIMPHSDKELSDTGRCLARWTIQRLDPHTEPRVICSVVENNTARLANSLRYELATLYHEQDILVVANTLE